MYELKLKKMKLREEYTAKRRELDPEVKAKMDKKISDTIVSLASYRFADILLVYHPTDYEIDIRDVIERALHDGKRVALPRCRKEDRSMKFHFITSTDELRSGAFGIKEPPETAPVFDPYDPANASHPAACIIPALVYDREGYRLGYGKGYYDRYLPKFKGTRIGLLYSDFLVKAVPRGRFDLKVDVLVTEKGIKAIGER